MALTAWERAHQIFIDLSASAQFPEIDFDLNADAFQLPSTVGGFLNEPPTPLSIEELTDTNVDGSGTFDIIMTSLASHLYEEHDTGRITGREYAEAYTQIVSTALQSAIQFTLAKDQTAYQNTLVQMQARAAEVDAIAARSRLLEQQSRTVSAKAEALTAQANYTLTKMKLATEAITYDRLVHDVTLAERQIEISEFERDTLAFRLQSILPEERRQLTYQTDHVLRSQVAKVDYEVQSILPRQAAVLDQDISIKTFQRNFLMEEQYAVLQEQHEVQRSQTLDTRSDGTPITGTVGRQKELHAEQISSYIKDARYKAAKLWSDSWIAQKSIDEGLLAPNEFTNANVNEVLSSIKATLELDT